MFTETVLSVMLANILGVAAALPFIAAQQSLTSDGKRSQPSPLEGKQALPSARSARRRGQDRKWAAYTRIASSSAAGRTKARGGELLRHAVMEA